MVGRLLSSWGKKTYFQVKAVSSGRVFIVHHSSFIGKRDVSNPTIPLLQNLLLSPFPIMNPWDNCMFTNPWMVDFYLVNFSVLVCVNPIHFPCTVNCGCLLVKHPSWWILKGESTILLGVFWGSQVLKQKPSILKLCNKLQQAF